MDKVEAHVQLLGEALRHERGLRKAVSATFDHGTQKEWLDATQKHRTALAAIETVRAELDRVLLEEAPAEGRVAA